MFSKVGVSISSHLFIRALSCLKERNDLAPARCHRDGPQEREQCSLSGREEPTTIVACSIDLIHLVGTIDCSTTITGMQADVCLLIASPQAAVRTHLQALCSRPNHALTQLVNGGKVLISPRHNQDKCGYKDLTCLFFQS